MGLWSWCHEHNDQSCCARVDLVVPRRTVSRSVLNIMGPLGRVPPKRTDQMVSQPSTTEHHPTVVPRRSIPRSALNIMGPLGHAPPGANVSWSFNPPITKPNNCKGLGHTLPGPKATRPPGAAVARRSFDPPMKKNTTLLWAGRRRGLWHTLLGL